MIRSVFLIAVFSSVQAALLAPWALGQPADAAAGIRVERAVPYLPPGRSEKADLYLPSSGEARRPAVLVVHGGGWEGEQRDSNREVNIAMALAEHGYVCMSIDYKLALPGESDACWPQNLFDCKTAVRWLRAHADELQVDADHVGAIGGSAGGHLAAMTAVTGPDCKLDPDGPHAEHSCRIQCAVDMYGPVDMENWRDVAALRRTRKEAPELYRAFSVLTYVSGDDPPILIVQGDADEVTPVSQSEAFARKLGEQRVPHQLEVVAGLGHSFDLQPDNVDLRPLVLAFFDRYLRP